MTKFVRPLIPNLGAIPPVPGWLRVWLAMWLSSHLSKDALDFANVGGRGGVGFEVLRCFAQFTGTPTNGGFSKKNGDQKINERWAQEQKTRERAGKLPLNLAYHWSLFFPSNRCSSSDLRSRIPPDA